MDLGRTQVWSYTAGLPEGISAIRELLEVYSNIAVESVDEHLLYVRDEAWACARFPCIGRWKFLSLNDPRNSPYHQVLFRLKLPDSKDCLLDVGSGLGQILRQYRADGVDGTQLFATDVNPKLFEIGFSLFRDQHKLGATFVAADMIDPDDTRIHVLRGKVTIIHATSFFHLFTRTQQLFIGNRLVSLLKPGTRNGLIYGRHVGIIEPRSPDIDRQRPYLHNKESFQRLWDEVGLMTNTKWLVQTQEEVALSDALLGSDDDKLGVSFIIYQIS